MNKRRSSHALLDATEKALIRLIKRTEPVTMGNGATIDTQRVSVEDQLEVVLAATKFLAVKHKILPDEGDDDDSFLTRAQRRLNGTEPPDDGKRASNRRRRNRPAAGEGSTPVVAPPTPSPTSASGTGTGATDGNGLDRTGASESSDVAPSASHDADA